MQQEGRTAMGEVTVFANGGILIFNCTKGAGVGDYSSQTAPAP